MSGCKCPGGGREGGKKKVGLGLWRRKKVECLGSGVGWGRALCRNGVTCRKWAKGERTVSRFLCASVGVRRNSSRGVGGVWVSVPGWLW